ncbi:hypothetical protein KMT30_18885 [Streptomyces sp. IBSBF 2953]|uniref:hypothetical protein n=1 Tax=Streptomyces hayashii TaxID=2839966 RepID=UPI00211A957B|nr:hypothetical protein [Streptomyces hayashii]
MQPSRAQLGIMATLLGLVAVLGVVWLVRSATTDNQSSAGSDSTTGSADARSNASGDGDGDVTANGGRSRPGEASNGADGGGTKSSSQGEKHKNGPYVPNGVNLQGNGDRDGCVTVINKTSTPAVIESISFVIVDGHGGTAVHSDNGAHCFNEPGDEKPGPPCQGLKLIEGDQCLTGAVLASNAKPGEYTVEAVVHTRFRCDNDKIDPCNYVKDWGGRPPTKKAPVDVRGSGTSGSPLRATIVVKGPDSEPPDDSPSSKSPSPHDGVSPPPDVSPGSQPPDDGSSSASGEG